MKNSTKLVSFFIVALMICTTSFAQAPKKVHPKHQAVVQKDVRTVSRNKLKRNVEILKHAKKQVQANKNYTGDFSRAVKHQKFAYRLHNQGKFKQSIHHSHMAKKFAVKAIKANKGDVNKEWSASKDDMKGAPTEAELEQELPAEELSDEEALNITLEELGFE